MLRYNFENVINGSTGSSLTEQGTVCSDSAMRHMLLNAQLSIDLATTDCMMRFRELTNSSLTRYRTPASVPNLRGREVQGLRFVVVDECL